MVDCTDFIERGTDAQWFSRRKKYVPTYISILDGSLTVHCLKFQTYRSILGTSRRSESCVSRRFPKRSYLLVWKLQRVTRCRVFYRIQIWHRKFFQFLKFWPPNLRFGFWSWSIYFLLLWMENENSFHTDTLMIGFGSLNRVLLQIRRGARTLRTLTPIWENFR